jgi:hypothetical protein
VNLATRIYEKVAALPQQAANEVLHFAEFIAARYAKPESGTRAEGSADATTFYARYQADLSTFRFDRDEANAR